MVPIAEISAVLGVVLLSSRWPRLGSAGEGSPWSSRLGSVPFLFCDSWPQRCRSKASLCKDSAFPVSRDMYVSVIYLLCQHVAIIKYAEAFVFTPPHNLSALFSLKNQVSPHGQLLIETVFQSL